MAILNNLIVRGNSRLLNKLYVNEIDVAESANFINITASGDITASTLKASTNGLFIDNKQAIYSNNNNLYINGNEAFSNGVDFGNSFVNIKNSRITNQLVIGPVSITSSPYLSVDSSGTNILSLHSDNASFDYITGRLGVFDNFTVEDVLRAYKYNLTQISALGGDFYVAPVLYFKNPRLDISDVSENNNILTFLAFITDSTSITSSNVGGVIWSAQSKVKISGVLVKNSEEYALKSVPAELSLNMNSNAHRVDFIFTINKSQCSEEELNKINNFLSTNAYYESANIKDLAMMIYERGYRKTDGTIDTYPVGILLTGYGTNNASYIDIYNGSTTRTQPKVRLGYLNGLSNQISIQGASPTGWGLYADNVFLKGYLYATGGSIGGFTINTNSIYSNDNSDNRVKLSTLDFDEDLYYNSVAINSLSFNIQTVTNLRFAIGKYFAVKNDGTLYTNKIQVKGGKIGSWGIDETSINSTIIKSDIVYNEKTCARCAFLTLQNPSASDQKVLKAGYSIYSYIEPNNTIVNWNSLLETVYNTYITANGYLYSQYGKLGCWNLMQNAFYSDNHPDWNTNANGIFMNDEYLAGGPNIATDTAEPMWFFKNDGSARIGKMTLSTNGTLSIPAAEITGLSSSMAGAGRNLIINTANPSAELGHRPHFLGQESDPSLGTNTVTTALHGIRITKTGSVYPYIYLGIASSMNGLIPGETYTLSFDYECKLYSNVSAGNTTTRYLTVYLRDNRTGSATTNRLINASEEYISSDYGDSSQLVKNGRIESTFTIPSTDTYVQFRIQPSDTTTSYFATGDYIEIKNIMFEHASYASDYCPAPEDLSFENVYIPGTTKIDGANIETGSIHANQIVLGDLTNLITANESDSRTAIKSYHPFGSLDCCTIANGYIQKGDILSRYVALTSYRPNNFLQNDEIYYTITIKSEIVKSFNFCIWFYGSNKNTDTFGSVVILKNVLSVNEINKDVIFQGTFVISKDAAERGYYAIGIQDSGTQADRTQIYVKNAIARKKSDSNLIVDGSIVANKISTGAITTDKIEADAITTDKIKTGAITANKIKLGDYTNLVNILLTDPDSLPTANTRPSNISTLTVIDNGCFIKQNATNSYMPLVGGLIPNSFKQGEQYYYEFNIKSNNISSDSSSATISLRLYFYDNNYQSIGQYNCARLKIETANTWQICSGSFVIPATITNNQTPESCSYYYMCIVDGRSSSTKSQIYINKAIVRRKAGGELIVDGAITANKIDTGAITADKIAAGAITANKISTSFYNRGKNLIINTKNPSFDGDTDGTQLPRICGQLKYNKSDSFQYTEAEHGLRITEINDNTYSRIYIGRPSETDLQGLTEDTTYTLSFDYTYKMYSGDTTTSNRSIYFDFYDDFATTGKNARDTANNPRQSLTISAANKGQEVTGHYIYTFLIPDGVTRFYIYVYPGTTTSGYHKEGDFIELRNIMLVQGNQQQPYEPAIEDNLMESGVFTPGKTTIQGGNITTNSITTDKLVTDLLKSSNYKYTSDIYADSGTYFNLNDGSILSKNFAIDSSGNAFIRGKITANADSQIGPWHVTSTAIYKTNATFGSNTAASAYFGDSGLSITNIFQVNNKGKLTATNADITGVIKASSGIIGNNATNKITIGNNGGTNGTDYACIYSGGKSTLDAKVNGFYIGTDGISIGDSQQFKITKEGTGQIAGWQMNSTSLSKTLYVNGNSTQELSHVAFLAPTSTDSRYSSSDVLVVRIPQKDNNNNWYHTFPFILKADGSLTATNITAYGTIKAESGSQIGPWMVTDTAIYKKSSAFGNSSPVSAYFGNDGLSITNVFKVTSSGALTATNADITGVIKASSGIIGNNATNKITIGTNTANASIYSGSKNSIDSKQTGFYIGANGISLGNNNQFKVTDGGALTATGVDITGMIKASSGIIGNNATYKITIGNNTTYASIYSGSKNSLDAKVNGFYIGTNGISLGSANKFKVTNEGKLTAKDVDITGVIKAEQGGTIGGWSINKDSISSFAAESVWASNGGSSQQDLWSEIVLEEISYSDGFKISSTRYTEDLLSFRPTNVRMNIGNNFGVEQTGKVYAAAIMMNKIQGFHNFNYSWYNSYTKKYVKETYLLLSPSSNRTHDVIVLQNKDTSNNYTWPFFVRADGYVNITYLKTNTLQVDSIAVDTGLSVFWNSDTGLLKRSSSSKRYKDILRPLTAQDVNQLYNIQPVLAKYKDNILDSSNKHYQKYEPMFIAQDVNKYYPAGVVYQNELIEDWNYRYMIPAMFQMIKDLKNQIDQLKASKGQN